MATKRTYGDACRFAHALDLIGDRWALLVVRELLLGPKRFTDLRAGLPHASSNILSERLRDLERNGVVRRSQLPPPAASWVYQLTEWGAELEPVVTKLGAWGARSPFPPCEGRIGTDSIVLALRSLFDPAAAGEAEVRCELRIDGERFHVEVGGGEIDLGRGPAAAPAFAIETETDTLAAVLTGQLGLDEALESGAAKLEGSVREASTFLRLFPMPEPYTSAQAGAAAESGVVATR
jgi:DNA-binding HxlR family transcriptional regulator